MIDLNLTGFTPQEELFQRIEKFQRFLHTAGIQGALIVQNADLFYFSGTCQNAHLFIPAQGEPLLMARRNYERALEESSLEKIIRIQSCKDIRRNIDGILKDEGSIGLELDVLPTNLFFRYKEMFEPLEVVDVSRAIREIRAVKSPYEITCMKEAVRATYAMFEAVPNLLKEGMTEVELSSRVEQIIKAFGHHGCLRLRAFNQETPQHVLSGSNSAYASSFDGPTGGAGLSSAFPYGPGYKKIAKNEPVLIDFGVVINGYIADHTRIFSIGPLSEKMVAAHNTALEIKRMFMKEMKPGIDGKDIYDMACSMAGKAGLAGYFMGYGVSFVGHGVGLELDELPVIAKNYHVNLQKGMVLAMEPKFVFPGEGTVGIEDTFIVTDSGLEQLIDLDDSIKVL